MNGFTFRLILAFSLALILTILPMPSWLSYIRPCWVMMVILYCQFYLPRYFNISFLFFLGLALDALLATVIGEHPFVLLITSWIASNKARRFCFFSMGQQMALIGFLCLIYQSILFTINAFLGFYGSLVAGLGSVAISALLWPWVRLFAEEGLVAKMQQSN